MRMRKRHNLLPRMEACAAVLIENGAEHRGRWLQDFPGYDRVWLEIGCGKGRFTVETAKQSPDALFVAIEKVPDAMILAMERAQREGVENVRFLDFDAARLPELFAPGELGRIYLNFSDPWPKSRDAKFRLTAPNFLRRYADALPLGGEIHFKTDNTPLFNWSLEQFEAEGWELDEVTNDLHGAGTVGVMTDYEEKFVAEGLKINRLAAARTEATRTTADGELPRLRNAALADARGRKLPSSEGLRLTESTPALCHAFFRELKQAPELFERPEDFTPFVYDAQRVEAFCAARRADPKRRQFALLLDGEVIGDLGLKRIDREAKTAEAEICLKNDACRNRGYGTAGLRLMLEKGFAELGLEQIEADTLSANTRSQRMLKKLGFRLVREDESRRYYRLTRADFRARQEGIR